MATFITKASHIFHPGSDQVEDATALRAELLKLVAIDLEYIRRHRPPLLYKSGVVYGRTVEWLAIPDIIAQGYADCKSLSPWRIAEMMYYGICRDPKPEFRYDYRPNGGGLRDFHVLIETEKGYECPSRNLGMGKPNGPHNRANAFAVSGDSPSLFAQQAVNLGRLPNGNVFRLKTSVEFPGVWW